MAAQSISEQSVHPRRDQNRWSIWLHALCNPQLSMISGRSNGHSQARGEKSSIYEIDPKMSLLQHFDSKLMGWASRLLSPGSHLTLLKSVLTSIPLHLLAASRLPKSVIHALNRKISLFLWGGQHHWTSLENLCYPEIEGGWGIRSLVHIQRAYDCKLWWNYHSSNSLWAVYMRERYGQRMDYLPRIYDSPSWKRICSSHTLCLQLTTSHPAPIWRSSPTCQFSLRYVYEDIRPHHAHLLSHKFIWWKGFQTSICMFIWKLLHSALPMEDNIKAFSCICPTICPFCQNASASTTHVFLLFPCVQSAWMQLSALLDGPVPQTKNIRQYLLQWWINSSAKSLKVILKSLDPSCFAGLFGEFMQIISLEMLICL